MKIKLFSLLLTIMVFCFGLGRETAVSETSRTAGGLFVDSGQSLGDAYSTDIAFADFDNDGDQDAFVSNGTPNHNEIWLNQGGLQGGTAGLFQDSGQEIGVLTQYGFVLGDLDGDTDLDIFLVRGVPANALQVWLNQGGEQGGTPGTFQQNGFELNDELGTNIVLGDVDGDNDLDAYIPHFFGEADRLYLNDGSGFFTDSGQTLATADSYAADLADLDGDEDLDLFVAVNGGNSVWFNQGGFQGGTEGIFQNSGQVLGNRFSRNVRLADLDGDSDADAFVANSTENIVWLNQGGAQGGKAGYFQSNGQLLGNSNSLDAALADFDGDGDLDAFVANNGANKVWLNQGGDQGGTSGNFQDSGQLLGEAATRRVAVADVDGDEDVDVMTANNGPNRVWLNGGGNGGGGTAVFITSGQYLGGDQSYGVAVGDLDGDGHQDAFVANNGPNAVWFNTACAFFTNSGQQLGEAASWAVALGDVDNDDDLDAFVANSGPNAVWLNDGGGNFSHSGQAIGNHTSFGVALGDVDGDGDLDAFVANINVNQVWFNGENGDPLGIFSSQSVGNSVSQDVALGDTDLDDDLDALVANSDGPNTHYYNVDGLGDFVGGGSFGSGSFSNALAVGNLNGDGYVDIFVANGNVTRANEVWLNDANGFGTFSDSFQRLGDSASEDVGLADLDGDGDLDAFVVNSGLFPANKVWLNDGTGTFSDSELALGDLPSRAVALADLDHDGDVDAFVGNSGANRVWLNNGRGGGAACQCIVEWLSANQASRAQSSLNLLDVNLFYGVRDGLLGQTAKGQHYIDLYYAHDPEILMLVVGNGELRSAATAVLAQWQPHLQALLSGQGEAVTITAAQVQAVDSFLVEVTAVASPALQQVIAAERANLPPLTDFVGMTMLDAYGVVVGYETYLPLVAGE
ncbi:MAG: VCBS repeat-containing protein [Ardenticatenaceae bacterium]|nr:VCBS repeat-containing protein [Ardenticatenaceae bacterium]